MSRPKKEVTYSEKTDRHAEHKHLFGSTENSDFIINMTGEGAQKLCGVYSIIAVILLALSSVPYYISELFIDNQYNRLSDENSQTLAFFIMVFLIITGFIGLLMFMISCMKKEVLFDKNTSVLIFGAILLSAVVSTLASSDIGTSVFGYLDRAEGLISIIGYIGFFAIGMSLTGEKWRDKAISAVIGVGTVNAVVGILQSIPALSKFIPSYYNFLFLGFRTDVTVAQYFSPYGAYSASYAADGFTGSPFALTALLTAASALALGRAVHTDKTSQRILCLVCTGLMFGALTVSQTTTAFIAIGAVLLAELVLLFVDKGVSKDKIITIVLAFVTAGAVIGSVAATDNLLISDEQIIFTDSFERLGISYNKHSDHTDNIFSTLWYDGSLCFQSHAVLGVGPDNWGEMYNSGEGMETDRTYNEILDTAVTRGIVGAGLYLVMIVMTFIKAGRMLIKARKNELSKTMAYGLFAAFTAYFIQSMFNTTSISCTPYFYLIIGIIWCSDRKTLEDEK